MWTLLRPIWPGSVTGWWMELDGDTPPVSGGVHINPRHGLAVLVSNGGDDPL
jgi:hypothetical protein